MFRAVLERHVRRDAFRTGRGGVPDGKSVRARTLTSPLGKFRLGLVASASLAVVAMLTIAPHAVEAAPAKQTATVQTPPKVRPVLPAAVAPLATMKPIAGDQNMVLEADQVVYDDDADTVTAIGAVQIYYAGNTLTAQRVTYRRKAKRVIADGDARMVDKDGNVLTSPHLDVSEGFLDGFVQSLRIETIDRARFAAESATRSGGDVTVFEKGVYSACQTCANDPVNPPFWQIKAARIVHKQQEKTIYYEDARLEMLGTPIAWVPYFQHPDPSEKRRTGFLMPRVIDSTTLGIGVQVPYYWAPVADWDATLAPVAMSRQGLLMDLEVRHKLDSGLITVRGLGIHQIDAGAFKFTSGDRVNRGAVLTTGQFTLNENWKWGWDITSVSDRRFLTDYRASPFSTDTAVSTVFLTGQGLRNHFDARLYRFTVLHDDLGYDKYGNRLLFGAGNELQDKQAVVHPVIDYDFVGEQPVAGGEVSGHLNIASLSRTSTDIDTYGRAVALAGTFSRLSTQVGWRRQVIDDIGQVWTPFASLRGDVFYDRFTDVDPRLDRMGESGTFGRVTPTLGLDWRYPFIAQSSFGAHTFSPIAQFVARPSERWMGRLPNEDAQSIVFDDTTLFRPDKFSGWDRAEGGSRVNLGAEYTFHAPNGGSLSAMVGRSYLVAGENSFGYQDYNSLIQRAALGRWVPLTAFGSGLEAPASDWVARLNLDSATGFRIGAQTRLDQADFSLNRADIQAVGTSGPVTAGVGWAYLKTPRELYDLLSAYDAAGIVGAKAIRDALKDERSELQTHANLRLATNWRLFGGLRYDLKNRFVSGDTLGVGYDNDSFSMSLSYIDSTYTAVDTSKMPVTIGNVHDQTIYLRFGFRTLGDGQLSNSLSTSN